MEMWRGWDLKLSLHLQVWSCLSGTTSQGNDAALWVKAVHTNNTAKGNSFSGRLRGSLPRSLKSMWQERWFHSLPVEVKMGTAVLERNSTVHIRNPWWLNVWTSHTISGNLTSQKRLRYTNAQCTDADTATAVPLTTTTKENRTKTKLET